MTEESRTVPHGPDDNVEGGEPGPLSKMLIDNAPIIDEALDKYGPSAVAEFFTNVGTSIAVMYNLNSDFQQEITPVETTEG